MVDKGQGGTDDQQHHVQGVSMKIKSRSETTHSLSEIKGGQFVQTQDSDYDHIVWLVTESRSPEYNERQLICMSDGLADWFDEDAPVRVLEVEGTPLKIPDEWISKGGA